MRIANRTLWFAGAIMLVRYDDERIDVDALTRVTTEAGYPSRIAESSP